MIDIGDLGTDPATDRRLCPEPPQHLFADGFALDPLEVDTMQSLAAGQGLSMSIHALTIVTCIATRLLLLSFGMFLLTRTVEPA